MNWEGCVRERSWTMRYDSQHLPGETEENYCNRQSPQLASVTRFKSRAFRYRGAKLNAAMSQSGLQCWDTWSEPNQQKLLQCSKHVLRSGTADKAYYCSSGTRDLINGSPSCSSRGRKFTTQQHLHAKCNHKNVTSLALQFTLVNFRIPESEAIIPHPVRSSENISNLPITFSRYHC
jgi:hypothetical protein